MKKIICVLLALIMMLSLAGCKNVDESTENSTEKETTQETTAEPTTEIVDYNNLVVDAYEYEYSDEYGDYTYNIPTILLAEENIERINDEIWDWCYEDSLKDLLDVISEGTSIYLFDISYEWFANDDILSLCVAQQWESSVSGYKVYNVRISTGENVTKDELLSHAGFSQEEYVEKAEEAIGSEYLNYYSFDSYSDVNEFAAIHKDTLKRTLSDENINNALPFINENGELCIVCLQYSVAGADSYYRIYNLENFKLNSNYLDVIA